MGTQQVVSRGGTNGCLCKRKAFCAGDARVAMRRLRGGASQSSASILAEWEIDRRPESCGQAVSILINCQ